MSCIIIIDDEELFAGTPQVFIGDGSFEEACREIAKYPVFSHTNWEEIKECCEEGYFTAYDFANVVLLKSNK